MKTKIQYLDMLSHEDKVWHDVSVPPKDVGSYIVWITNGTWRVEYWTEAHWGRTTAGMMWLEPDSCRPVRGKVRFWTEGPKPPIRAEKCPFNGCKRTRGHYGPHNL